MENNEMKTSKHGEENIRRMIENRKEELTETKTGK